MGGKVRHNQGSIHLALYVHISLGTASSNVAHTAVPSVPQRATFSLGMSPDSPLSSSPGGLSSSPTSGLGLVLGDGE